MYTRTERNGIIVALWMVVLIVALAFTDVAPVHAQGGIIYVDRDAAGANDGSAWSDAYISLSDALANATSGDEIWVAEGVYTPTAGITRTATFSLVKGVALYGGFAGTETQRTQRDWAAHVTVLSGDLDGDDGTDANGVVTNTAKLQGANAYHVVIGNGVTETAILDGFTITAGKADGEGHQPQSKGGGMFSDNSRSALSNVIFAGNRAEYGGGMYNFDGSPTLTHVRFRDNQARAGGGLYNAESEIHDPESGMTLAHVTFTGNRATQYGGGMCTETGSSTLIHVTFTDNHAADGGGMCNIYSSSTLTHVMFADNYAEDRGGGMCNFYGRPTLSYVTFTGNQAESGGGIRNAGAVATLTHVIFTDNQAADGGGMFNDRDAYISLSHATFADNRADGDGGGVFSDDSDLILKNSILWGNRAIVGHQVYIINATNVYKAILDYSLLEGGCPANATCGTHLLTADPRFVAPHGGPSGATAAPTSTGDYHLQAGSPAIDAGDDSVVTVAIDLDGEPRIQGLAVDLGVYEYPSKPYVRLTKRVAFDPGGQITYTLAYLNPPTLSVPVTATGVVIRDRVPVSVTAPTVRGSRGAVITATGTAPDFVWAVQPLVPGAGGVITLQGTLNPDLSRPYDIVNTAIVTGDNIHLMTITAAVHIPGLLYVDQDATGAATGFSWTDAFTNLQDALVTAHAGDEIWIAEGVYYPDVGGGQVDNDRAATFSIQEDIALYGGFAGTETTREQRDWATHVTVLSGDIDGNDWNTDTNAIAETWTDIVGDNAYHVLYLDGQTQGPLTRDTVIDGFTITAGQTNGGGLWQSKGAGLYCVGSGRGNACRPTLTHITFSGNQAGLGGGMANWDSSPTLYYVIFTGNQASMGGGMANWGGSNPTLTYVVFKDNQAHMGGGVHNARDSLTLTHVTFTDNQANIGGGMWDEDSRLMLTHVSFTGNQAKWWGGGIANLDSRLVLTQVMFKGNQSDEGGGMDNWDSNLMLINVMFTGNQAGKGGGIDNWDSNLTLTNITFADNWAGEEGGGVFNEDSEMTLTNSILWGNRAGTGIGDQIYITHTHNVYRTILIYSLVEGGCPISTTCDARLLTADPRFVAPRPVGTMYVPTSTGNYRLQAGSPAIDAGDDGAVTVDTDLDGHSRIYGAAVDLGAYESQPLLALRKRVTPTYDVPYHGPLTYTITLSNAGTLGDADVQVSDRLPPEVAFARWVVSPTNTVWADDTLWWNGPVAPGRSLTWTWGVTHVGDYDDVFTNTVKVRGTQYWGTATARASVVPNAAPLRVIKSVDTGGLDPVPLGHGVTYTLVINNAGAEMVHAVVMTDPLPAGIGSVGWVTGSVLLPPPDDIMTWGPWDIPPDTAHTVVFTATVTNAAYAGRRITNIAYFDAANHAPGVSNRATFTLDPRAAENLLYLPIVMRQ